MIECTATLKKHIRLTDEVQTVKLKLTIQNTIYKINVGSIIIKKGDKRNAFEEFGKIIDFYLSNQYYTLQNLEKNSVGD
jgi:hypothetical protein